MHSIKITPNLLFEYQCTSGKFIRLPNRIETFFCTNCMECSSSARLYIVNAIESSVVVYFSLVQYYRSFVDFLVVCVRKISGKIDEPSLNYDNLYNIFALHCHIKHCLAL